MTRAARFLTLLLVEVSLVGTATCRARIGAGPIGSSSGSSRSVAGAPATEILWDTWGVPHIYATSEEDAAYAYGWAQAEAHGEQIIRQYGIARGRAAEYWGERYLASDRLLHTLGIPEQGQRDVAAQSPEFQRYLAAFASGVNAYVEAHPNEVADSLRMVLPVTAADLIRHTTHVIFTFVALGGGGPPMLGLDGLPTGATPGSNAWAIGPSRSATGKAMLLQNPHLPWDLDLMRFFEAQIVSPGVNVSGVTLIGMPVVIIGLNDQLGWSHTVNTLDAMDTYRLRLTNGGYLLDGKVRAFDTDSIALRVGTLGGTQRTDTVIVRRSVHGPVVRMGDTTALAIRSTALDAPGALETWWDLRRAHALSEFERPLRRQQIAMFNVIYADREGHIMYLFNGRVPVRPNGDFAAWQNTMPGENSSSLWTRVLPYDSLPRIVDPASGFVQNSNSPPWFATIPSSLHPEQFPSYLAPVMLNMREQRALQMLTAAGRLSFDDLLKMRYSNRLALADRVLDDLIAAARASGREPALRAAKVLADWDRAADAGSRGTVLFATWVAAYGLRPFSGRGFTRPWSAAAPITTPSGLSDPERAVIALESAADSVQAKYGALDVPWGDVNRFTEALPGNGQSGDPYGVFHVVTYAPTAGKKYQEAMFGDTFVSAVEFTDSVPRAVAVLSYGNSSRPGSRHVRDQLGLVAAKRMRPVWRSRRDVEANLEKREVFGRAPN